MPAELQIVLVSTILMLPLYLLVKLWRHMGSTGDKRKRTTQATKAIQTAAPKAIDNLSTPTTNSSCGGLGMPDCVDPHSQAALSGNSWRKVVTGRKDLHRGNVEWDPAKAILAQKMTTADFTGGSDLYHEVYEAERAEQYAHASSTYADPYTEPEPAPAQAEPPATPSRWGEGYDFWRGIPRLGDGSRQENAPQLGGDTSEYIDGVFRDVTEQELSRL